MSRALLVLTDKLERERAIRWIGKAPTGTRVVFQAAQRSTDQNSKLWAMLSEVATQCPWHGVKLTAEDWKFVFLDALKRELRMVPNLEGNGFVNIGRSSSNLSKAEMSDLIELIHAFGAQHGVTFHDDPDSSQPPSSLVEAKTDKPATEQSPLSQVAGTNHESSSAEHADDGSTGDDERAAPDTSSPVADKIEEASLLSPDWQDTYLRAMTRASDKPKSLLNRHTEALQLIGGKANAAEQEWMRAVFDLRKRNLQGELSKADYDAAIRELADG